jgi:hypothetical protein
MDYCLSLLPPTASPEMKNEASSDLIDSDPNLNLMVQRDDHKLVIFVSPNKGITKIYATVNLMILIITYHN